MITASLRSVKMAIRVDGEVNKEMDKSPRTTGQPQDAWAGIAHEINPRTDDGGNYYAWRVPTCRPPFACSSHTSGGISQTSQRLHQNEAALHEYDPATKQKITNLTSKPVAVSL